MPWCPKCRNEYREGFTVCADCGVELVNELGEVEVEKEPFVSVPFNEAQNVIDFLEAAGIKGVGRLDNEDGTIALTIDENQRKKASRAVKSYAEARTEALVEKKKEEILEARRKEEEELKKAEEEKKDKASEKSESKKDKASEKSESKKDKKDKDKKDKDKKKDFEEKLEEEESEEEAEEEAKKEVGEDDSPAFKSSKEKADDARNSAIALIVVGILGLTFEGLVVFKVLPLQINGIAGAVLYGFMALVFLVLVVSGIMSIFTANRLRSAIVEEENHTDEIVKFCKENAVDFVSKMIPESQDENDESAYFNRIGLLKMLIRREDRFSEIEDDVLDNILDENYAEIFGQKS
jgi:flagellar biosynthesis GTPase FlhF